MTFLYSFKVIVQICYRLCIL